MQLSTDLNITSSYDSCRIAARDFGGSGFFTFVLLHGAGRSLADWGQIGPQLSRYGRVVAIDLRGHGHSGDGTWSLEALTADLEDVLAYCGASKVIVVGHSLGGVIATLYSSHSSRSIAVVNIDGFCLEPERYKGLSADNVIDYWSRIRSEFKWHSSVHDASYIEDEKRKWITKYNLSSDFAEDIILRALKSLPEGNFTQADSQTASDGAQWLYADYFWKHSFFGMICDAGKPYLLMRSSRVEHPELCSWQEDLIDALENGVDEEVKGLLNLSYIDIVRFDGDHLFHLSHGIPVANEIVAFLDRHSMALLAETT